MTQSTMNLFVKGMACFENKEYELSIAYFSNALEVECDFIDALFYRGIAKRELGFFQESIGDFKRVLELDPKHIASLHQISYSYSELKLYEEALAAINCLIELEPDWHSFMQRSAINKALGNIEESKLDEKKAWAIGHDFCNFK